MNYIKIVEYLRQCPQIRELLPIAGEEEAYSSVILCAGGSSTGNVSGKFDNLGGYEGQISPIPTVYRDYQINCYRPYDVGDNSPPGENINALTAQEVDEIYNWIAKMDNEENFPDVEEKIVSVECTDAQSYIRGVDADSNIVCYAVTLRIWYVNETRKRRSIYYER